MNGIVNFRRRPMNRLPRLVIIILILAVVAVVTPATAPVNAQQTSGICDRTQEVVDWILTKTSTADCADVTDSELSAITGSVYINHYSNEELLSSDFAGLTGVTEVYISASGALKRVPADAFDELTKAQITWVSITLGGVEEVQAGVFDGFTSLEELQISYNAIQGLEPGVFNGLSSLKSLSLTGNALKELDADLFDGLSALEWLFLNGNRLTTLEEDLFDGLSSLQRLRLESNDLTTLDEDIFDGLSALSALFLHRNSLTTLPADLFDGLSSLQLLEVSYNSLTTLDEDLFDGLSALRALYLHNNDLTTLDEDLFDGLPALRYLYLHNNDLGLSTLDAELFDGLSALQYLYLYGNGLTTLDAELFDGLSSLQLLDLSGNGLTTLDKDLFDDLSSLGYLDLGNNSISTLPEEVFDGLDDSLGLIYLRGNSLTMLDEDIFDGLTALKQLDISCNALTALDLTLFTPFASTLTYLNVGANNFTTEPVEATVRATLTALDVLRLTDVSPCASADDVGLSDLTVSAGTLTPPFAVPGDTLYALTIPLDTKLVTIVATPRSPNATWASLSRYQDSDENEPGIQFDLSKADQNYRVSWRVYSEDGSRNLISTMDIFRERVPAGVARLRGLQLSNLVLSPAFESSERTYTSNAPFATSETTVTALPLDPDATTVVKLNGTVDADGTVDLAVGTNTITVEVTAEDGTTMQTYTVTVTRAADTANLVLSRSSLSVGEAGSDTFTVKLATQPSATVTVTVTSDDTGAATASPASLTFTTTNWNTTQTVTVRGVDDSDTANESLTVTASASGGGYNGKTDTVSVTVTDNDTANLVLSRSSLSVGEAGSDTFTVKLATQPSATVTVTVTSDDTGAATASPASLTFTTTNWNTTQTVTVRGVDDSDTANESLTVTASASGGGYAGKTDTVSVTVTDNDTANLVLSRSSLSVGEAGSDTFTVKLATQPSATVTVTVTSDDTGAATASPASLTFTTTNWNSTQTVTVRGVDDSDTDNESLTVTASASGGGYAGKTDTVSVTVTDDDTANLVLSRSSLSVGEAGSDTFTVKLATQPSATVTVTVTSDDTGAATASPASLTFTTTNWNTTQTVTVRGVDDSDTANESLTVTASASGGGYNGKTDTVSVTVTDNDTGLTTVTFGASSYTATEGGSSATVVVRLSQAPATQVTIPLTTMHRGGATGGDYSGIPDDVRFTSGQMQRTFTVTAVDDSDDDDGESVQIGFDELPSGYAQGSPAMTTVALVDDEGSRRVVVGFTTHTAYTVERRESESRFRVPVRLDREPLRSVTIPLVVTHLGGATAADYEGIPVSVTFGPNDTKADFFMRVIPDEQREIGEGLRIDFGGLPSSVSKDSWAPYETIEFVDDLLDSTVWFGTDAYTATEGGAAAQVSIHLDAPVKLEPLDVGLVLRYGGGATAADHGTIPAVVRFAIGERTKTITVAATNDSDDDDGESVTLSFVNVSGDRVNIAHQPTMANTTMVSLADDDGPKPVTVSFGAATYTAREGGSGASVSVELDATPGRSVTVPLTTTHRGGATSGDYSGVPSSVTFEPNETRQTFTVTAMNDTADDDGESLSIGFGTLPASVSAGSPAVVALDDDDGSSVRRVRVGFDTGASIAFQVRESTWPSRITLSLNRVAHRTVTIPLVVTHLGGATAADYTGIPESVTFGPDQRRVGFRVYGTLDEEIETGEGLRIDFGTLPPGVRVDSRGSYETVEFVDTSTAPDTGTAATTYTDDTVAAETPYTYRIKAINAHGTSERSRWFHIDTLAGPEPTQEPTPEPTPEPESVSEGDTDLPNDNSTPGRVAVGGSATGAIGTAGDQDRFSRWSWWQGGPTSST